MTVAIKSTLPTRRRASRKALAPLPETKVTFIGRSQSAGEASTLDESAGKTPAKVGVLKALPNPQLKPLWLRSLLGIQRTSSVVSFLLLSATLTVYGFSVYAQQRWSEEYQKLESLRRSEQQLSTTNEVLKHQIATAAENPDSGLAPQHPEEMIFLPSAPERPAPAAEPVPNRGLAPARKSIAEAPLGY